jgi:hypothetical protein
MMAMSRSFMAEATFTGGVRTRGARTVLLNMEMTGMRPRAVCEPRSVVGLCGAIHERPEKGKGDGV